MAFLSLGRCLRWSPQGWAPALTEDVVGAVSAAFSSRGSTSGSLSASLETLNQVQSSWQPIYLVKHYEGWSIFSLQERGGRERDQLCQSCSGSWSMEAESSPPQRGYRWSSKCTIAGSGKQREGWTEQDLLSPHSWNWVQKLIAISRETSLRCEGSGVAVMGAGCVWWWRFESHPSEHRQ